MNDDICLTPDEVESLRDLLAMLATMEERGFEMGRTMGGPPGCLVVTRELWRDTIVRAASGLQRVGSRLRRADQPEPR